MANTNGLLILDFCHLVNTLTNTNNIPKVYLYYLANTLIPIAPKVDPSHLANILTNINDGANNFIKEEVLLRPIDSLLLITR